MKSIWHPLGNAESRAMFKYDTLFWAVKFMAQLLWLLHECPSLPQWGHVTELVAAVVITGGFINMPALPRFIGQSRLILLEWPPIPHELRTTAAVPLFSSRADAGEAALQSRWFLRECSSISQKKQTTGILTVVVAFIPQLERDILLCPSLPQCLHTMMSIKKNNYIC